MVSDRSRGARDQPWCRRLRQEEAGRPPAPAAAAGRNPGTAAAATPSTSTDAAAGASAAHRGAGLRRQVGGQLNAEKPLGDVFFDYDSATFSEEGRTALQKNADWLKRWTSVAFTVEGHCDNRGTPEYNLALGERRATAVTRLSREPWRPGNSRAGREQGRRAAVLPGRRRELLVAEPARPLHHHRQVAEGLKGKG